MFFRSEGADPGRDGCRVPLPWAGDAPPFGFSASAEAGQPWLPQPAAWRAYTAEVQEQLPDSMLSLYRQALRIRRAKPGLGDGPLRWLDAPEGVLAFARGRRFGCVLNLSSDARRPPAARPRPAGERPPVDDGFLAPETAAWLSFSTNSHESATDE